MLASGGYPIAHKTGYVISGLDKVEGATVFHAGTKLNEEGQFVNTGGRVLGVTAVGADLKDAAARAYAACEPITWTDMHKRTDIGKVWVD